MSSRTKRKCRAAIQVVGVIMALGLAGCARTPVVPVHVHESVGDKAKTLRYDSMLNVIGMGSGDAFKRLFVGKDVVDLERPVSIGLRDNIMYIADAGPGIVYKYDLNSGRMRPVHGVGAQVDGDITDIYVAGDHSFYLTDIEGRRAMHFSENGKLLDIYFHAPNMSRPVAIAVNESNGEVYVADEVYSHIVAFNQQGEPIYGMGGRGEGEGKFRIITDMLRTADGYLVSDRIELSVQILDARGRYLAHFGEGELIFPTALAVDQYGRIYVAEKAESVIKVFKQGKLIDVIGSNGYDAGQFRYVSDMKVHDNKLYVVDSLNGRIQVFDVLPEAQTALLLH